jgi:ferrous iron transport protein B
VAVALPVESGCHAATRAPADPPRAASVLLIGNPNVGKSVLFGALTRKYVTVSNYPGTTVEVTAGILASAGGRIRVVDTPGTASLLPTSEEERVTRDLLLHSGGHAVVLVADTKNLERTLLLAAELSEAAVPFVVCLNMMDEATRRGIGIDAETLAGRLGVDVVPTVAVRHEGIGRLVDALSSARPGRLRIDYPAAVEDAIARIEPLLPEAAVSSRTLAVSMLCGDESLSAWLRARLDPERLGRIDQVRDELRRAMPEFLPYVVGRSRRAAAERVARAVVSRSSPTAKIGEVAARLERLTTHRWWGLPILGVVLYLCYQFVGVLGAGTLVNLFENRVFGGWVNPAAIALADRLFPGTLVRDLLVGPYGVLTMALTYALALILPIVTTFFIAFGVLEDSGYLPRLAVMVNRAFRKMGLNGKAVLPMVLGLGCDTMATLTTRVLETPKERLIVILLLALGVPCSAQLAVVMTLLSGLSPAAALVWAAVVAGVIVIVGRLAAAVLPGRGSDFILELPPLRVPRPGNLLAKTLARVEWYLREAVPLFVLGTLILFVADRLRLLGFLERLAEPVVTGALGLPPETAGAFLIGFLRRDFGAAGLYRLAQEGRLQPGQVLVAAVTITLFIPCIANFFMIVKERGWRTALAIAAFIFPFAVGVGAALNALLRALPVAPW